VGKDDAAAGDGAAVDAGRAFRCPAGTFRLSFPLPVQWRASDPAAGFGGANRAGGQRMVALQPAGPICVDEDEGARARAIPDGRAGDGDLSFPAENAERDASRASPGTKLLSILRWERGPRVSHVVGLYLIAGVCGLVDAACFLALGEVFAEMMTGNLLLLSFDIGTFRPLIEHAVYLVALGSFAAGAVTGGRIVRGAHGHTRLGFAVEWVFLALAVILSLFLPPGSMGAMRDAIIALLAFAMGLQNALLRRHGVPDLATNVMTLTLTALVADSVLSGGQNERWRRRASSIGVFMACAVLGAALTKTVGPWAPMLAALIFFSVALTGLTRQDAPPPR